MRSELPDPWLVPQQEQQGRYLGSERINKPSLGRTNSPGLCLRANLFLILSSTRARGTPSAQDLSPFRGRHPPSLCPSGQTLRRDLELPGPLEELTWYMMEEGGGSMHGCWSGKGSSSSRSTLDRASSRVTWVVMAAAAVFCTEGKEC